MSSSPCMQPSTAICTGALGEALRRTPSARARRTTTSEPPARSGRCSESIPAGVQTDRRIPAVSYLHRKRTGAGGRKPASSGRSAVGGRRVAAGQEAGGESCGDGQVAGPRDGGRFWDGFVFPAAQLELGLGLLWASAQSSSWIQKAEPGRCLDEIRPITVKRIR